MQSDFNLSPGRHFPLHHPFYQQNIFKIYFLFNLNNFNILKDDIPQFIDCVHLSQESY